MLAIIVGLAVAACAVDAPSPGRASQALGLKVCLTLGNGCCDVDADCPSTACRKQACDASTHMCKVTSDTCACTLATALLGACSDGNLCTVDTCDNGVCKHAATALCCLVGPNCDDGDACSSDTCAVTVPGLAGTCVHARVADPQCCNSAADCGAVSGCGTVACTNTGNAWNDCVAMAPGGGSCCAAAADCPQRECQAPVCTAHACAYSPVVGGIAGCCATPTDCALTNACQVASCVDNVCHVAVAAAAGCCATAADCPASDACHATTCTDNTCGIVDLCGDGGNPEPPRDLGPVDVDLGDAVDLGAAGSGWASGGGGCAVVAAPASGSFGAFMVLVVLAIGLRSVLRRA